MTAQTWVALIIPLLVTGFIAPYMAYRYAVKTANRQAEREKEKRQEDERVEGRRLDLAEWKSMTDDLRAEIARLRTAREEDDRKIERIEQESEDLERRYRAHLTVCQQDIARLHGMVRDLHRWERQVWDALADPGVYRILESAGFRIPPPPVMEPGESGSTSAR